MALNEARASARVYFWPLITLNTLAMSFSIDANIFDGAVLGSSLSLLASFGFIFNDICDRRVDNINKAKRLEACTVSDLRKIGGIAALLLMGGLSLASAIGEEPFTLAALVVFGLIVYTIVLRRILLVATLLSGAMAVSPLWIPLVLWGQNATVQWRFIAIMFIMVSAREIILDIKDVNGDGVVCRHTIATVFGLHVAKYAAFILTTSALALLLALAANTVSEAPRFVSGIFLFVVCGFAVLSVYPLIRIISTREIQANRISHFISSSRIAMVIAPVLSGLLRLAGV